MDIAKLFADFPEFFAKIVKTTSDFGPLALGILLLFIVLLGIYQFKGVVATNPVAKFGAGIFVLVVAGLLLYFIVQSFNFWLKRQSAQTFIFVQGTVLYDLPSADGDLYFDMWSVNAKDVGESREHIYGYDNGLTEKQILSVTKPDKIELTVANRQIYQICSEDSPKLGTRNRNNRTKYIISLKDAYLPSGNSGTGVEHYGLDFDYKSRYGSPTRDFLRVTGFNNIDAKKVSVQVRHEPEKCVDDDQKTQFVEIVTPKTTDNFPGADGIRQLAGYLRNAFVSVAFGQKAEAVDVNQIVRLLDAADLSLATKARSTIAQNPGAYIPVVADLLHRQGAANEAAQTNILLALKTATPKAYKLPLSSLPDVIRLSYMGSADVRQAARNYLTDPAILDQETIDAATQFYNAEKTSARSQDADRYLLLLIAMREMYYVGGINKLNDYVGDWGERERVPEAVNASLKNFQAGIDLIGDVPKENIVPFAKSYYGMALVLRQQTAENAAVRALGPKATFKDVDAQISGQVKSRAPLPFSDEERTKFTATIDAFLNTVKGREGDYLWPDHIAKMKACRARQTYDCLHAG